MVTQRPTRSTTNIEDGIVTGRLTLKLRTSRLNVRKHFFSNRIVESWNCLPDEAKCAKSTLDFKINYDKFVEGRN